MLYNRHMKKTDEKVRTLVLHTLFTAIIAVLTLFASIPLPVGSGGAYLNAGDAAIYAAAYVLGPIGGAIAASVGSALADVLHGAVVYAPATFVIKGLMGLIAGLLFKKSRWLAPLAGGIVMPLGYFAFEYLLYGSGTALFGLWTNAIQFAFGVIAGILLVFALGKTKVVPHYRRKEEEKHGALAVHNTDGNDRADGSGSDRGDNPHP